MLDRGHMGKLDVRLSKIEGQVRGLRRMLKEHRDCADLLVLISAMRAGLAAVGEGILRSHIQACLAEAVASPHQAGRVEKVEELVKLVSRICRGS